MKPMPADKMQAYIETARKRQQHLQEQLRQRQTQGIELAKVAARILRETFGVSRVVLFGSILDAAAFHENSDLDIAVWDLPPADYIEAVARLLELSEFSIDLVPAELASPHVQAAIEQGMPL
ncbi:MAG: nucleotidyltransferase domain-containing protein [Leptolyngbya sp. SIO1D8]|nr:nucleotidyltransferase domain-containing protein [Leptolyngbya sp. SIO1D8]